VGDRHGLLNICTGLARFDQRRSTALDDRWVETITGRRNGSFRAVVIAWTLTGRRNGSFRAVVIAWTLTGRRNGSFRAVVIAWTLTGRRNGPFRPVVIDAMRSLHGRRP